MTPLDAFGVDKHTLYVYADGTVCQSAMFGTYLRTIVLQNLDRKQPIVGLPMPLVTAGGAGPLAAEFAQPDADVLIVRVVSTKTISASPLKRFRIVEHRGTHWTSLPKPWLRDRGATDGDMIEVWWTTARDGLALRFIRQEDVAHAIDRVQVPPGCAHSGEDE